MQNNIFLIITSIAGPTSVLQDIADNCKKANFKFILIGDRKSPDDFYLDNCSFYGIKQQLATGFSFAEACPLDHYARKNIGYLLAIRDKGDLIVETDDDNIPYPTFWERREAEFCGRYMEHNGWTNVYSYFTPHKIWPRGFPLDAIRLPLPAWESLPTGKRFCPIQQGLADENPDLDAIARLLSDERTTFRPDRRIAIGNASWCPFNSQNTAWWPEAFCLMYLPAHCSFRMTDIWRSFVALKISWVNGWTVLFHGPTVRQERNLHSLMKDFQDEIPGYLYNKMICESLDKLPLKSGREFVAENMVMCYEELVSMGYLGKRELDLLACWIRDLKTIGFKI